MEIPKRRYTGWKEIVAFVNLGGQAAIRRLAREKGFPLRKVKRTVFVFQDEVENWLRESPAIRKCRQMFANIRFVTM